MKRRKSLKQITESQKQDEKLIVDYACSLENEIRFYINENFYAVAREDLDGTIIIGYKEKVIKDEQAKQKKENVFTRLKKQIKNKELFKSLVLTCKKTFMMSKEIIKDKNFLRYLVFSACEALFITIVVTLLLFITEKAINDNFMYMALYGVIILSIRLVDVIADELIVVSRNLKSKHSAEHMMLNFLEKNKRLPRSMEELKSSSRFTVDCGSRKKIHYDVESSVIFFVSTVLSYPIVTFIIQPRCKGEVLEVFLSMTVFTCIGFCVTNLIYLKKLRFFVKIVENALNYIIQLANTTRNVKEKDLQIAYCAANLWLQIAYPQFYSEEDRIFYKSEKS